MASLTICTVNAMVTNVPDVRVHSILYNDSSELIPQFSIVTKEESQLLLPALKCRVCEKKTKVLS